MIKEMAIDLVWLALLFSAIGFNIVIVGTVALVVMNIVDKFKEGYKSKDSSKFTTEDNRDEE